ncbi:MAG: PAS domain S-box protein [Candidatus Omnitrophica bacterium]|nr:PAS domain S-box protein [Candidatus Omnitrophota bacterium]
MSNEAADFKDILDNVQTNILRSSANLKPKIIYMNPAMLHTFGYTLKKMNDLFLEDLFEDQRKYQIFKKQINSDKKVVKYEARLKAGNGNPLLCSISAVLVSDEAGKVKWMDLHVEDVTSRKWYEKELIESKELFQTVFNNSAAAIIVIDKTERLVAWNPYAEKMLGRGKGVLFNMPVKNLFPSAEWKRIKSFGVRKPGVRDDIETQLYKNDGDLLDVNLSSSTLKDLDGNIIGAISIIRDITMQKVAERKIKESENKIRVILDNTAAGITLTDDQERIVSWNKYTEELFGLKKKDIYLKHVSCLYPKEEWDKIRASNIRKIGFMHHMETKITRKTGEIIDINLSVNVLMDSENNIVGSVGIMQDITKQKRTQEMLIQAKLAAEEANSAKSLFLANMSHEVRTPINTVIGMIDLTLDTPLNPEQKENLEVAKDASINLLSLLNDILDLSRVEVGKIKLEEIEFHLHNVANSVTKGMSVLAKNKNLETALKIHENVPELVLGDPVRLRQVLVNLINNAIKFTHKGKITTEIKVASKTNSDVMLLFSVIDEGIGIPKDKHEKIFEIFTQADDSTTRRFGGTGLGLAICKRLVDMMGGRVWVESEESKGSTFHFTAVFKTVKKSALSSVADIDPVAVDEKFILEQLKGLKILLAEDNLVNQKIAVKLLEKQGWTVSAVENGQEAVNKALHENFDVVLMDANMPILDGLEATRLIRENEQTTGKHVPIIALTARAMQEDKGRCLDAGMDGYVSKPIDRKELFLTIGKIVSKGKEKHE